MNEISYPQGLEPLAHSGAEWQAARAGVTCKFVCGLDDRLLEHYCGRPRKPGFLYCHGHLAWMADTGIARDKD